MPLSAGWIHVPLPRKFYISHFSSAAVSSLGTVSTYYIYFLDVYHGSSFVIYHISGFVSLPPCLTSFKWDQGGKKPTTWRVLSGIIVKIRAYVVRKMIDSWLVMTWIVLQEFCHCFRWDQDWALGCSEKWIWAMWFFIQTFQNSGVFKSGIPLMRTCNACLNVHMSWCRTSHVGRVLALTSLSKSCAHL